MTELEARARAAAECREILDSSRAKFECGVARVRASVQWLDVELVGVLESGSGDGSEDEAAAMSHVGEALGGLLSTLRAHAELAKAWADNVATGVGE